MDTASYRIVHAATLFLIISSMACSGGSAQQAKPIKENALITEFKAPPDSLNEMVLQADAVVVGRITGLRPNDKQYAGLRDPRVRTLWALRVREVLYIAGAFSQPEQIEIEREGGDRDRGTHIERVIQPEFPAFDVGHEYVLFLRKADGVWWPAYGPDSAFRLSKGQVEALGSSKIGLAQHGKTEEAFLRAIRNFGVE